MIEFKTLEPDDIEVRVQQVTEKGCSLLLYKNARTDAKILDDAVGQENWDCEYSSVNGYLFCTVGIRCELPSGETSWVYKSDTGTQSNMEPEKGHASDAFKRACTRWGIGRELYTAPFVWVDKGMLQKHYESNSKWRCNDRFSVQRVEIKDGRITDIAIGNQHGLTVYQMPHKTHIESKSGNVPTRSETAPQNSSQRFARIKELKAEAMELGVSESGIDGWIEATFKGKPKKELNDNEIKMTEAYLASIIRDKKAIDEL